MKKEYKKVKGSCYVDIVFECPYCGSIQDVFEDLRDFLYASDCDKECTCEDCEKVFIVENVY